jgi:hypothetical protein
MIALEKSVHHCVIRMRCSLAYALHISNVTALIGLYAKHIGLSVQLLSSTAKK